MTSDNRGRKRLLPKPIPERIKEAREARGFTLEGFAEALGVSRQAVAQFETGQAAPSGDTMSKIIVETAQPLPFFIKTPARVGDPPIPFWRSLKRMELHHRKRIATRLKWTGDICSLVERFIDLPTIDFPAIEFDPEVFDEDQIERAAEVVREHWGLGRGPIHELSAVMEAHGIVIVRELVRCSDMDAVSCWIEGRPFVLLSDEVESGPRDSFNLAHELGHIILHAGVEVTSQNLALIEKQANRFAGAFLLPRETFSREVLGTSLEFFKSLKARWGVAIAAMAYRCKDLDIFTDNQFSYLFRQMNYQRIRKIEPLDDAFPVNRPKMLAEAVHMIIENDVYSRDQFEDALGLNMDDVESICGVSKGYLNNRVVKVEFRTHNETEKNS